MNNLSSRPGSLHGVCIGVAWRVLALTLLLAPRPAPGAAAGPAPNTDDLVVHEWGTFTSIQGSDGTPIPWNPFVTTDLPSFVLTRGQPTRDRRVLEPHGQALGMLTLKTSTTWLQRMETPVLYFYSERECRVDVEVRFPKGLITEWFPQASAFGPVARVEPVLPDTEASLLRWNQVRVLSRAASTTAAASDSLPVTSQPSHYYPARQTRANLVEVTRPFAHEESPQRDRLLFYRGAGNFAAPLHLAMPSDQAVQVRNSGAEAVGPLFLVNVRGTRLDWLGLGVLGASESRVAPVPIPADGDPAGTPDGAASLAEAMRDALVEAGLFGEEADAMLATWKDSWFAEEGLRVLYLLPSTWTDRTLPLSVQPRPRDLRRIMVGRADVLTPDLERQVMGLVRAYFLGETTSSRRALLGLPLGRFLEAAMTRAGTLLEEAKVPFVLSCGAPNGSARAFQPGAEETFRIDSPLAPPRLETGFQREDWKQRTFAIQQTLRAGPR